MKNLIRNTKAIRWIRTFALVLLLIISLCWLMFALLSGVNQSGEDFNNFISNLPNALPWMILFFITLTAFKHELAGAASTAAMAVFIFFFFNAARISAVFYFIFLPLAVISAVLFVCWFYGRKTREDDLP